MTEKETKENKASKNLAVWDVLAKTDPDYTTPVSFGARKFTSIDAYYQIKKITELFGPVGIGWKYNIELLAGASPSDDLVITKLLFSYRSSEGWSEPIPVITSAPRFKKLGENLVLDDDAFKKSVTDALKKAFSYLGCGADVFMGEFDDKYTSNNSDRSDKPKKDIKVNPNSTDPATQSQIDLINKRAPNGEWKKIATNLGFNPSTLTKPQASKIIDTLLNSNKD